MENRYAEFALQCKALSDETRLKIIDMLSCGELCACDLLKHFNITQPTLSYHMKILAECGVVRANRIGTWMHYNLNSETVKKISKYWSTITSNKKACICQTCNTDSSCGGEG